jgi:hypothetical protein
MELGRFLTGFQMALSAGFSALPPRPSRRHQDVAINMPCCSMRFGCMVLWDYNVIETTGKQRNWSSKVLQFRLVSLGFSTGHTRPRQRAHKQICTTESFHHDPGTPVGAASGGNRGSVAKQRETGLPALCMPAARKPQLDAI